MRRNAIMAETFPLPSKCRNWPGVLTNREREPGSRVPAAILKVAEYESQSKA